MDDVLKRFDDFMMSEDRWRALRALRLIEALAAEVRALRKDRERLDWVLENCFVNVSTGTDRMGPEIDDREDIDAAMASSGEDS